MKTTHRIFHILNRNIAPQYKYSFDEIKEAFSKEYKDATERDRFIYGRFFRECEDDDLESFIEFFGLSEEKIKEIYEQTGLSVFRGVALVWSKYFGLKIPKKEKRKLNTKMSDRVKKILERRGLDFNKLETRRKNSRLVFILVPELE